MDAGSQAAPGIARRDGVLHCEDVPLPALAAQFGTPLHVYSAARIRHQVAQLRAAFRDAPHRIHYAVKANSNLAILRLLAAEGVGFDIVSGGELMRVVAAGLAPADCVFAGVGKEDWEIEAALTRGISCFNVESEAELRRIDALAAARGLRAAVALRLNPDVDPGAHRYVTTGKGGNKFGIDLEDAPRIVRVARALRAIDLCAYHVHLGSTLARAAPYVDALRRVLAFVDADPEHRAGIRWLDLGGGFGVRYRDEDLLDLPALGREVASLLAGRGLELLLEPGRFLVAESGCLLTRVLYGKQAKARRYVVVDAAMNDLIRPSLYQAWHGIEQVVASAAPTERVDVVGPVCESSDFLGFERDLPRLATGDLLAVLTTGVYGASMGSNYNSRRRPAEVLITGARSTLIRQRESIEDLWRLESQK